MSRLAHQPSAGPAVLLVAVLAVLATGCGRAGGEVFQPTLNTPIPLAEGSVVGQSINPAGEVVTAVDLHVATYDGRPDPNGTLTVALREPDGGLLDLTDVPGEVLTDNAWVRAEFDPPVAVDGLVVVEASWEGATSVALWANAPPEDLGPGDVVNDPYPAGQLVLDGQPIDGDLAFRVLGSGGIGAGAGQAGAVARSTASRLRDQPVFTALWLLLFAGSAALAVTGLRRRGA